MQAAGKEENPFLTDDSSQAGAAQDPLIAGEKSSRNESRNLSGPPARPPPPRGMNGNTTSSPARIPKSAFDDLNDSIRVALNASPSKAVPFSSGGSFAVGQGQDPPQQPVAGLFSSSSSHQHTFAPSQMFSLSSAVEGQANVIHTNVVSSSSSSIGGGSQ